MLEAFHFSRFFNTNRSKASDIEVDGLRHTRGMIRHGAGWPQDLRCTAQPNDHGCRAKKTAALVVLELLDGKM